MSDEPTGFGAQSTATVMLVGIVSYLIFELARNGNLNAREFHKHLDDLGGPDSLEESPEEKRMRLSILGIVRKSIDAGAAHHDKSD